MRKRLVENSTSSVVGLFLVAVLIFTVVPQAFAQSEPITLRISSWWLSIGGLGDIFRTLGQEYERQNPHVKIEWVSVSYGEYLDKMKVSAAVGDAPDVMFADQWWTADLIVNHVPMKLDAFIERDSVDMDGFIDASLKAFQSWWDDSGTYGLPVLASPYTLIANPSNFDNAGLPKPDINWNTTDFWDYARKLTGDDDGDGEPDRWAVDKPNQLWNQMIINFGGEYVSEDGRRLMVDSPKSLEGMEWLIDLQRTTRAINVTDPGFEAFLQGRAAMARAVNPNVAHWLLPFPGHERQIQEVITHGFMISAGTKYPDEAWNFVKWVTLGDGALFFASMGENPARTDSHLWNEWLIASSNWNFSDISGLMPNIGDGTNTQPTIPGWQGIMDDLGRVFWNALVDPNYDLRVGIASNISAWQARLDEFWASNAL